MKRHKHKHYGTLGVLQDAQDRSCEGCVWYHDWSVYAATGIRSSAGTCRSGASCTIWERAIETMEVEHNGEREDVELFHLVCFPNGDSFTRHIKPGDRVALIGNPPGKIGTKHPELIGGTISEILYAPRPWWAFWRRRKPVGYYVQWE